MQDNPTTTDVTTATPIVVEQVDREAAAAWAKSNSRHAQAANMRRGSCDTAPLVQAFARHRHAERERCARHLEERAAELLATSTNHSIGLMMSGIFRAEAAAIREKTDA